MISNYYPTEENPLTTMDNMKYVIKQSKTEFATKAELASYATTETVTALEGRVAAIETEITGVAASLASLIGG